MPKKKQSTKKKNAERTRNWSTILYPESCDPDWKEFLLSLHVSFAVSPLHDKDVDPNGEVKKAHWHIVFAFDSVKSYDQVKDICDLICATPPQVCFSLRGQIRYFCHLDNPDKYPYNPDEIFTHCLDIQELLKKSQGEIHHMLKNILQFCRDNKIVEFCDLIDYCVDQDDDWFDLLSERYTLFLTSYLSSLRGKNKHPVVS